MKKHFILFSLLFLFAGSIYAQFTLEKFLDEKLAPFNYNRYSKLIDIEKKVMSEKLENIQVKVEYLIPKEGGIMRQSITSDTKDAKLMKKLFDHFFTILSKKYPKTERDETYQGTRNVVWRAPDNTMFTLGSSSVMTSLTMVKMQ